MKIRHFNYAIVLFMSSCISFSSCSDDDDHGNHHMGKNSEELYYANIFAKDVLSRNYYWNEEIANELPLLNPRTNDNPIETVEKIRYHQGTKEVDKWTTLFNHMDDFENSVEGVNTTYGYLLNNYRLSEGSEKIASVVTAVFKNSPAEKAGLRRGDIIIKVDGQYITEQNLEKLYYSPRATLSITHIKDGALSNIEKEISLESVTMYENPILLDSIYEFNNKKVGYLAYTNFDLNSIPELIHIAKKFKTEGVTELILDLRYNGGGFVITENVMASMYVPEVNVKKQDIFEKELFNKLMMAEFKKQGKSTDTRLTTEFNYDDINLHVSTKDANIGLNKVYGLITQYSASASEALLSGLMPYLPVQLIGQQSHGKYCTGWMINADEFYKKVPTPIKNWGMYAMVSIYQNALGETPCRPNGLTPDTETVDNPLEALPLGDVNESMLKEALRQAGKTYPSEKVSRSMSIPMVPINSPQKSNFGKRILISSQVESFLQ